MGRRGHHSFDELSKMIIDSAYGLIEKHGVSHISTRKIATEIGYSVGTLYNVYQNINDILIHINSRTMDIFKTKLEGALMISDSKEQVNRLAKVYLDFSVTNFHLWSLLFEYRFPQDHVAPKWYKTKINSVYMVLHEALLKQFPNLDESECNDAMLVIWSGIHGICALHLKGKLDKVAAKSAETLIDNFLKFYLIHMGK